MTVNVSLILSSVHILSWSGPVLGQNQVFDFLFVFIFDSMSLNFNTEVSKNKFFDFFCLNPLCLTSPHKEFIIQNKSRSPTFLLSLYFRYSFVFLKMNVTKRSFWSEVLTERSISCTVHKYLSLRSSNSNQLTSTTLYYHQKSVLIMQTSQQCIDGYDRNVFSPRFIQVITESLKTLSRVPE